VWSAGNVFGSLVMSVFGNDAPNLSTEDGMRDSLQNLLPADQRANFMSLFSKFLQQKQQTQKYATTLESYTEPVSSPSSNNPSSLSISVSVSHFQSNISWFLGPDPSPREHPPLSRGCGFTT
jgi:hypothetical protein